MEFGMQTANGYEQFTTCTGSKLKAYLSLSRSCKLRPVGELPKVIQNFKQEVYN
jgi:hypothetical protein